MTITLGTSFFPSNNLFFYNYKVIIIILYLMILAITDGRQSNTKQIFCQHLDQVLTSKASNRPQHFFGGQRSKQSRNKENMRPSYIFNIFAFLAQDKSIIQTLIRNEDIFSILNILHRLPMKSLKFMKKAVRSSAKRKLTSNLFRYNQFDNSALAQERASSMMRNPLLSGTDIFGHQYYSCIGKLKASWFDGALGENQQVNYGTAFLLSSPIILTCLSNIYDSKKKRIADQVIFIPNANESFQTYNQTSLFINQNTKFLPLTSKQYQINSSASNYVCLIKLSQPIVSSKYIKLGLQVSLKNVQAEIIGYPSKKDKRKKDIQTLRPKRKHLFGYITQTKGDTINHSMKTRNGYSGSPILIRSDEQIVAVGIHTHYRANGSQGIYFNQNTLRLIRVLISQLQVQCQENFDITINVGKQLECQQYEQQQQQKQFDQIYSELKADYQFDTVKQLRKMSSDLIKKILSGQIKYEVQT